MQVVVDKLLVQYELMGKGDLVILLHGWGDSSKGNMELQKKIAEKYQVLAFDLPGFGASQAPGKPWDLDNYADFVKHTLTKLKLGQPYAVVGHSNGGALAIRAVSLGKLTPQKLILIAASGVRTNKKLKRIVIGLIAKVGKAVTFWLPSYQRHSLRQKLYKAAGSDMLIVPDLQETFKRTVRQDVQADATKLNIPTLLIYGREDKDVPLKIAYRYNKIIKNSKLKIISDAGHFVHRDKLATVATLIKEFLA